MKNSHALIYSLMLVIIAGILGAVVFSGPSQIKSREMFIEARSVIVDEGKALVSYYMDNGRFPPAPLPGYLPTALTTPIHYLSIRDSDGKTYNTFDAAVDPFQDGHNRRNGLRRSFRGGSPKYYTDSKRFGVFLSPGPDRKFQLDPQKFASIGAEREFAEYISNELYDPTNGAFSSGDIYYGLFIDANGAAFSFLGNGYSPLN